MSSPRRRSNVVPSVEGAMTTRVYSVTPTWSLLSTARLLRNHHISGVPVVDPNDRVVGVVSETDLVRELNRAAGIGSPRGTLDLLLTAGGFRSRNLLDQCLHHLRHRRVRDAMCAPAVVVDRDAPLVEAARLLQRHGVNRLPVVEEGRLVGILSRQDLVESMRVAGSAGPSRRGRYRRGPPSAD
ncbi:MAG TPA: CBS domain-containing protein [Thermoplasmata archaeon]|nr:CBS domain-containing protein [Thermoplasmata archaeon]